jgi:hypothetical protein
MANEDKPWPDADDIFSFNALRLTEFAYSILSRHGPGPDLMTCLVCQRPSLCPLSVWAAEWICTAYRHGLVSALTIVRTKHQRKPT